MYANIDIGYTKIAFLPIIHSIKSLEKFLKSLSFRSNPWHFTSETGKFVSLLLLNHLQKEMLTIWFTASPLPKSFNLNCFLHLKHSLYLQYFFLNHLKHTCYPDPLLQRNLFHFVFNFTLQKQKLPIKKKIYPFIHNKFAPRKLHFTMSAMKVFPACYFSQ